MERTIIFRPYRRDPRTGEILWARKYGLKAWPIQIDDDADPNDQPEESEA